MGSAICYGIQKGCINGDSYGEICVGCGCCSKDKSVRYAARLKMYQEDLERQLKFSNWLKGCIRLQRRNQKSNITYCKRRISIYKRLVLSLIVEVK
jgi:hypothetical protein